MQEKFLQNTIKKKIPKSWLSTTVSLRISLESLESRKKWGTKSCDIVKVRSFVSLVNYFIFIFFVYVQYSIAQLFS